jgi:LuxR family transcriptional regulator, maltose regulon positive regulatory protein
MPNITNHAKVSPPRIPAVMHRTRLLDLLNKNQNKRLVFILGQAAQGKTTLAASYAKTKDIPVAWLNLDQGDSDPVNLFYSLIEAFQHIFPERDLSFLRSYPVMSQGIREPILRYREWVRIMSEQINDPVQLVLDGLDRLTANTPSLLFIQTLAQEAPPHLRLIMISREEPPFGLQELKIKQQAYVLNNDDLAFSLEETRCFFRETRKIRLISSQIDRIQASTEGWVGGLLLFSEALEKLPEEEREKYISEKMPDHFRMEAFRFFEEVILSTQPPAIREFLIKSSILDKMETEFIKDLLETEEMEEVLQEVALKHLFVQSNYDEGRGWVFRYHQLFRDFLLLKFKTELSAETRKSFFLKTGLLLEQRDRLEEAIRYFLQAGAYERAVSAIEKVGMDLVNSLRIADLQQWLQALPEEIVQGTPWLLYYLCRTRDFITPAENLRTHKKAFSLFEKVGDLRGCLVSHGLIISGTLFIGGPDLASLPVLLAKGEDLINKIPPDLYPRERSLLWAQIGYGFLGINPRKAYQAAHNGYLIARGTKEPMPQLFALIRCFIAMVMLQEISMADEIAKEIRELLKKHPYPIVEIDYHRFQGNIFLIKGDLEKAEAEFEFVQKECQRLGLSYVYTNSLEEYLILKLNMGQYREAEEFGQHILQLATAQGQFRVVRGVLLNLGIKCIFEGDYTKAEEYIQESRKILPGSFHPLVLVRGSLWSPSEGDETIIKDLQNTLDYFLSISSGSAIAAHFILTLISWKKGDRDKTAFHLHSGLKLGRERGIANFPYISPQEIARICALAFELSDQEDIDYALKILLARRPPQAQSELERLMNHPDPNVRARAAKISYALHRSTLPILRIDTLGGFRVIRADAPVKEEEWHGSQAKNLLKAIVALGKDGVLTEALMESLWPEGQSSKVEKNFKSVLHRLRRVLEPDPDKKQGYSYVQLKDNRVFLDREICQVDVDQFLALVQKGEQKETSRQMEDALSAYEEAADLYRGDFLPDTVYAEWADSRREELRRKYLGLLLRMARIYENHGAVRKAISLYERVVEFDPFSEEANRGLMILLANLGKHDKALHIYKTYQKALREELDAEPDELTRSIYNKIQKP